MPSVPPTSLNWPNIKHQLLTLTETPEWTPVERALVRKFVDRATRVDLVGVVKLYMELVRDLVAPSPIRGSVTLGAGGRLIDHVDPMAYIRVAPGETIDPVEFVERRQGNAKIRKRLAKYMQDIPIHLMLIKSQIIQIPSATVVDFPTILVEFVKSASSRSIKVPTALRDLCDLISRGQTCLTQLRVPVLNAFFYPTLTDDFRDLLTEKEALAFLKRLGVSIAPRTLSKRGKARSSLRQGTKYVRNELERAATEGVFKHGWKAT
jgi:hypothetical protein